jgi:hypothetical protein
MALRKTGEIMAVDEKDNRHKIIKYTDFETLDTLDASTELAGLDEYLLETGEVVNKVSDNEFVVVASGLKLRPE